MHWSLKKDKEIFREGKKSKQKEVLIILQKDLQLQNLPTVIECFDNSNFQGTITGSFNGTVCRWQTG